jgi:hypothetical protein
LRSALPACVGAAFEPEPEPESRTERHQLCKCRARDPLLAVRGNFEQPGKIQAAGWRFRTLREWVGGGPATGACAPWRVPDQKIGLENQTAGDRLDGGICLQGPSRLLLTR